MVEEAFEQITEFLEMARLPTQRHADVFQKSA